MFTVLSNTEAPKQKSKCKHTPHQGAVNIHSIHAIPLSDLPSLFLFSCFIYFRQSGVDSTIVFIYVLCSFMSSGKSKSPQFLSNQNKLKKAEQLVVASSFHVQYLCKYTVGEIFALKMCKSTHQGSKPLKYLCILLN